MIFCPKDGFEFQIPGNVRHGMMVCCPQCLLPMRIETNSDKEPLPFLVLVDLDKLTMAERNGYEQIKATITQQRLQAASGNGEKRIIL